jgi:RNA-directed DNA polymerase
MECCVVCVSSSPVVPVPIRLQAVWRAWVRARRGKKPSQNQLRFDARWLDNLLALHATLRAGCWQPSRTVSFIVSHPKTREIHAPDFADRVIHHMVVERFEKLYEPVFIHDSFANRAGRGSHAAVDRLQTFMRQRVNMGASQTVGGWYLQLDVHNFFNSIHRPTLYGMLCKKLAQAQAHGQLPAAHALALRSLCHKLLDKRADGVARGRCDQVPPHKRLCNAAPGCGLPVGNLTSQFFANVYLNALDQFVKHTLKVRHYVRYVDDFVLLGNSPEQVQVWGAQIATFLQDELRLRLRDAPPLRPCHQGVDFLGYVVFAYRRRVRQRVVRHCRATLQFWHQQHGKAGFGHVTAQQFAQLQALLGSYWGHFAHANSVRLRGQLFARMPWLHQFFNLHADGSLSASAPARWQVLRRRAVKHILKPEGETP